MSSSMRLCVAALAGSMLGIAYERLAPSLNDMSMMQRVSADASIVPRDTNLNNYKFIHPKLDPTTSAENIKHSARFGLPSTDNLRIFNDFVLSYDRKLRAPVWVLEHLNGNKLRYPTNADRSKSHFHEDGALHEYFRAQNADFTNSGFDRGHMAAAANHKNNQDDLDQTFVFSNISPQSPELNRGAWERLETYVRWRAKRAKNLYCVTGPLYLPSHGRDGNLYVSYRVLGNNHVAVPTHYFKVFLVEQESGALEIEAFLMPNQPVGGENGEVRLDDFRVPIERLDVIERASGVVFFDQLPRNKLQAAIKIADGFKENHQRRLHDGRTNNNNNNDDHTKRR